MDTVQAGTPMTVQSERPPISPACCGPRWGCPERNPLSFWLKYPRRRQNVLLSCHPQYKEQSQAVYQVLHELKVDTKHLITVFNKVDKLENHDTLDQLLRQENSIAISALSGLGTDELLRLVQNFLKEQTVEMTLLIPYSDSNIIAKLYDVSTVISTEYREDGIYILISLPPDEINRFSTYAIEVDAAEGVENDE